MHMQRCDHQDPDCCVFIAERNGKYTEVINSYPQDKMAAISQTHFREWKILYFDKNFTEVCS